MTIQAKVYIRKLSLERLYRRLVAMQKRGQTSKALDKLLSLLAKANIFVNPGFINNAYAVYMHYENVIGIETLILKIYYSNEVYTHIELTYYKDIKQLDILFARYKVPSS
jgi:hypothetical protein